MLYPTTFYFDLHSQYYFVIDCYVIVITLLCGDVTPHLQDPTHSALRPVFQAPTFPDYICYYPHLHLIDYCYAHTRLLSVTPLPTIIVTLLLTYYPGTTAFIRW